MIKDSETFIYIIPFHNEFGITFIWNVFLHCDLHKFSELKKARIVFRGDDIRDEANNLAILQELKVNPTGIVGISFSLAYGALKGHCSSQSDVVKAYTQSDLNTKVPTWVELPWELTPPEFRGIERPCVRLWKSLYGHPESGFHS